MTNKSFRNSMGLASLSALALVMVACGGSSSSSTPATPTNAAPSQPVIVGPTNVVALHPAFYNLSAIDPEGDAITFLVNGTAIAGNTYTLTPPATTTTTTTTLSVVARDSKNASSTANSLVVNVAPNHAPQFLTQNTGSITGSGSAMNATFNVASQDQDGDDVRFDAIGTVTWYDNLSGTTPITAPGTITISSQAGGTANLLMSGTVPAGRTSVTAVFTITAKDYLPGTTTGALGAGTAQTITLTYFSGNLPPQIETTSLPNLPARHYIPTTQGADGFAMSATDPNTGDIAGLQWTMTSSVPGLVLTTATGANTKIVTNSSFVPQTTTTTPITVNVTVKDAGGLSTTKVFSIAVTPDAKPTLNSSPYTETVSGVNFFDKSQVKDQVTSRARFYPGVIDWLGSYWVTPYVRSFEANYLSAHTDALANDTAFNDAFAGGTDQAVAGWTARTLFRDNEGDGINYTIDSRSVYVSSPDQPTGQPFTLVATGGPADVYPFIDGWAPLDDEFPQINAANGTMLWRPVVIDNVWLDYGPVSTDIYDNIGREVFGYPSIWSFTVMGYEKVWNPATSSFTTITDPSQAGRIDYSIKVQPNNPPFIGALTTIPNATLTVAGNSGYPLTQTVNITTISVGGGASISTTAFGRPSIQEPESKRYDGSYSTDLAYGGTFNYTAPNTDKPAIWRWLVAMPGGDPDVNGTISDDAIARDVEIYDPDTTTVTGHQDAIYADMSATPTVPAADTTGNIPTVVAGSKKFYNPWLPPGGNAGAFAVTWGPNRLQYLIARVTASAAYSFPVEVRDQYERINNTALNINPIFGTVRFTNSRTRNVRDRAAEYGAFPRAGDLLTTNNPGDWVRAGEVDLDYRFTFTYLPFPADVAGASGEANFGTLLFSGNGPTSGFQATGSGLYTAASWITLNAVEQPVTGFHTGNPLNNEYSTFNLPSYASAIDGTSSSVKTDWKAFNYTFVNGQNPNTPVPEDRHATGSWANHEVRAQVIPSNSPYLMSFTNTNDPGNYWGHFPAEWQGSTLLTGIGFPAQNWHRLSESANGFVYGLYQGEIDMQNAVAGRAADHASNAANTTTLRWTYSWPTQITNVNQGITATGGPNLWKLGDVMQIATPNIGSNARLFFTGDGGQNDSQASLVYGWGALGMTTTTGSVAPAADTTAVVGGGTVSGAGWISATNTPFHVASNSVWLPSNWWGTVNPNTLNAPNRTSFSPGASATQLAFWAIGGYMTAAPAAYNVQPGLQLTWSTNSNGSLISTTAGDKLWFIWLRQDPTVKTAWGTWDASQMVGGNSTYTATGGLTQVPGFAMTQLATTSTLPLSYGSDAQVSLASGSLPGVNHASNVKVSTDAALYNSNITSVGFARSQWGQMAPTMGYQPQGILTNNVRLVNPAFDSTNARFNNLIADFRTTTAANVSYEGGVRDSAIIYGVQRHTDENAGANAELGLAGIEPGSPLLAQWYNLQLTGDPALDASTVAATLMTDVKSADWPKVFEFYSPFTGLADWANVMEYKVNYLAGMTYPGAASTLWKVPASAANVFPLGAPVTDPSCTNTGNTINPANPIVRPIEFLRVSDYTPNTNPGVLQTTLDLVNSNPTNPNTGAGALSLGGNTYIHSRSNLRVTWQASVNNQVIPSGYVVEIFRLTGDGSSTFQPELLGTVRTGHIGGRDAIQKLYLPSMHSFSGIDAGGAVYFFKVKTVWHKGVQFEKQPTKQSIPMGYADYVSAPFVTSY